MLFTDASTRCWAGFSAENPRKWGGGGGGVLVQPGNVGGSGGMPPRKILNSRCSEIVSGGFWDPISLTKVTLGVVGIFTKCNAIVQSHHCHVFKHEFYDYAKNPREWLLYQSYSALVEALWLKSAVIGPMFLSWADFSDRSSPDSCRRSHSIYMCQLNYNSTHLVCLGTLCCISGRSCSTSLSQSHI